MSVTGVPASRARPPGPSGPVEALRPYWRIFVAGVREQARYVAATLGGLLANTVFGLLKSALLLAAVASAGGSFGGYTAPQMATYVWLGQGLLGSVDLFGRSALAGRVKDGSVALDFLRPVDVQAAAVVSEVGRRVFALLPRGVPSVLIGAVFVGMAVPASPPVLLLGALSILLGITLSVATVYLVAVSGFWLVDTRGVQTFYMVVSGFLAGLFVPITLFPDWLLVLAWSTPFPAMLMFPIDVVSGRVGGWSAVGLVGAQLGWLTLVLVVGQVATRAGRRRLEVQGG
ncbi:ABC-2 family transporter protein [Phycicoccus sp. CSK15P-2]|uniref:ABC transporter permease n=1 Tax=Phycicoccus sp. CSK15P-2 TaxID=2807627 RepID=UPI00194F1FFC|nr:ABC-2 family transporter protein [Phycicoccus sp. CSK15P-2]MBM6406096.1 ABC-2 family transporter protein [Phycicoccus sp. CSK15P-2]